MDEQPKYVVEKPLPSYRVAPRNVNSYDTDEWQVYRVDGVGMATHIAYYKHKAAADRVVATLNHWADEESES